MRATAVAFGLQGDPSAVPYAVENARKIIGQVPTFGICMGHQVMGQAFGADTFKLKFGHHGGNHPIRFGGTGELYPMFSRTAVMSYVRKPSNASDSGNHALSQVGKDSPVSKVSRSCPAPNCHECSGILLTAPAAKPRA